MKILSFKEAFNGLKSFTQLEFIPAPDWLIYRDNQYFCIRVIDEPYQFFILPTKIIFDSEQQCSRIHHEIIICHEDNISDYNSYVNISLVKRLMSCSVLNLLDAEINSQFKEELLFHLDLFR